MFRFKSRDVAVALAFIGIFIPGLHKFYLGQPRWGILYLLLWSVSPISRIASAIEAVWYLAQNQAEFDQKFNLGLEPAKKSQATPIPVTTIAESIRQLESLRQEGLVTEHEFERHRRQLLDRMV